MILSDKERSRLCEWAASWLDFHSWYECRKTHCFGEMICCYMYPDGIPLTQNISVVVFNNKLIRLLIDIPKKRNWFVEGIFGTKIITHAIYPNEGGPWWDEVMKQLPKAEQIIKDKWAKENSKRQLTLNKIAENLYGK